MAATLDDLLKKLEELVDATEEASKSTSDSLEKQYARFSLGQELAGVAGLQGNLFQPYAFIGQMNQMVRDRMEIMSAINKQAMSFGESTQSLKELTEVQAGADQFGPQIALKTSIDAMRFGLLGASKSTYELGMQMQAVGESSQALFHMQRQAQVLGGISISQMDNLSKSMEEARSEYGISTELLVNALGELGEKLIDFNLMGITADVNEAMIGLISKYGAGTEQLFTKAINSLTSGGNISKFARFGISDDVMQLMETGGMTPEAIESIAAKAGAFFEQQVAGFRSLNKAEAIAQAKAIYGEEGALFAAIAKLTPQERKDGSVDRFALMSQIDIQRDIARSIGGLADDFGSYLNRIIPAELILFTSMLAVLISIAATMKGLAISSFLKGGVTTILGALGTMFGALKVAMVAALGPILPVVLVVGALVGLIYGLYKYFEDDKPIQIIPPKTGGQFVTNEYMAANAELTKGILGSVFASQQMLLLSQAKQQTALMQQNNALQQRTARNTSVLTNPPSPAIGPLAGP